MELTKLPNPPVPNPALPSSTAAHSATTNLPATDAAPPRRPAAEPALSTSRTSQPPRQPSRLQKLRQMTPPMPLRRTMEEVQNVRRRTKELGSDRLVRYATADYSQSTKQVADSVASRFGMTPEEKRTCLKQLRLIRKAQKSLCGEVRQKIKIGKSDIQKEKFLDWLDVKIEAVEARHSESDED